MLSLPKSLQRFQFSRVVIVLFLLAIALIGVVPRYFTGEWVWTKPPQVITIRQLQNLKTEGLALANWQTLEHQLAPIGGNEWSIQALKAKDPTEQANQDNALDRAILLLLPQKWHTNQPQVEWMDINGWQRWTTDSVRQVQFTAAPSIASTTQRTASVKARFLRGWTQQQTYAVLQWYAWTDGGSPDPGDWFWVDRISQWRSHHRMPWVAVSVLIPIEPLGNIEEIQPFITSLGQSIQSTLMSGPLGSG